MLQPSALALVLFLGIGTSRSQTQSPVVDPCARATDCGTCVQDSHCYFCAGNSPPCAPISSSNFFSGGGQSCKDLTYKWATCSVSVYAFLIAIIFGVVLFLVSSCLCCYVLCTRTCSRMCTRVTGAHNHQRPPVHVRDEDRRARIIEIRRKYGIPEQI
ncbi:hypothetical protein EMCRGX_G013689 [Ephydatia muelleri]